MAGQAGSSPLFVSADSAELHRGGAADSRLAPLLAARAEPAEFTLPLPVIEPGTRAASASVDTWTDGSAATEHGGGAAAQGTAMELSSSASSTAWALYALDGVESSVQLQQLKIELSGPAYGGDAPGFWVALANFSRNRWDILGRSASTVYNSALNGSAACFQNGKVYAAVLLSGPQTVTVDRIGLRIDDNPWQSLELAAGSSSGVTPAIDFTPGRNPAVAWSNSSNGKVSFAICDRSLGFAKASSWTVSVAEDDPASASQTESDNTTSPAAKAQWLDLIIDPDASLPRISMLYTGLVSPNGNSRIGCTALGDIDGTLNWLNWRMGFTDGGYWTSIARDPGDFSYMIAWTAANQNRLGPPANRKAHDMELREVFWQTPVSEGQMSTTSGSLTYGFGQNWTYPHLRIRNTGLAAVSIDGGVAFAQQNPTTWAPFLTEAASGVLGSLAFAPDNSAGVTFSYSGQAGEQQLRYVDFDSVFSGTPLEVDSLASNPANAMAEVSQIGYLPDGRACIAYTVRTGSGVSVKFAGEQAGGSWKIETVSKVNSTPVSPTDLVFLDLAVDSAGVPAVCWTQRTGSATSLMVALRGT